MKDKIYHKHLLFHGDWFDLNFYNYLDNEKYSYIKKTLTEKKYRVANTGQTYRIINSWDDAGILLEKQNSKEKWRKFSLIDLCWIKIVMELRQFGYSLNNILKLKESIFNSPKNDEEINTTLFEFYIFAIYQEIDVVLVVFNDGYGDFATISELATSKIFTDFPLSYITVDFNALYSSIVKQPELTSGKQKQFVLDDKEIDVIYGLRMTENLKEVQIKTDNGKIKKIDLIKHIQNPEKTMDQIREMLKNGERKEITLKQENGKVVLIKEIDKL